MNTNVEKYIKKNRISNNKYQKKGNEKSSFPIYIYGKF